MIEHIKILKAVKERQAALIDLHYDVLKEIVIRAARSSDGAKTFAKTISVCKDFRQFVDDRDVLRAVCFDDLLMSGGWELFQLRGLICRCAQAGHVRAQFILAKLLTAKEATDQEEASSLTAQASYGNLPKGNVQVSSFLKNFLPDQTCPHFFIGFHFNFVKLFLSRARVSEFQEMELHLKNYMEYVIKCRENDWRQLFSWLVLLLVAKKELGKLVAYVGHKIWDMRLCVYEKMQILEPKAEEAGTMRIHLTRYSRNSVIWKHLGS
ncbi:hypothetical protein Cgig2_006095 [Carnegiea gigantea]|uniref:Uncharacterized protein n=1 Tax=Carnegiea gigantea TaxID=171969 RepID=A0A9Q1L092_9CARY|nr:hypothetical protein Cgig2_006095 [Carnegiea gigantea]